MTDELALGSDGARLVLARHGQTPSNVVHALDTLPPGPALTDEGRRQARALADRLAEEKVVAIRASRAVRAQQTAAPLARHHGLDVEVVDGTQEIYVGDLEGTTDGESRQRFEDIYRSWHFGDLDVPMPGGETGREALARFLGAARQALDGATGGSVVLVSHGAMLRLAAAHLAANVDAAGANAAYLPNTGVIVLEPAPTATGWHSVEWDGLGI
ncbi:histidine phosphatase family protein [Saccharopolyspora erythraea]|uniref:histidine phosphatase family protein n=1 Tax=Saccharopolyspora erythraea TaxID=1836 RepID=UPI001BA7DB68|nr:histidine phosphatase family protein [Saccharopolyspora erythraea]QUG99527.1 histidine phosphatase family protein [Saccharopolyspora erythraea]